jgi:phosphomannomutase
MPSARRNSPASRSSPSCRTRPATGRDRRLKVTTEHAWFAARPSGTEDVYKLYAESLRGPEHLAQVQEQARAVVSEALGTPDRIPTRWRELHTSRRTARRGSGM